MFILNKHKAIISSFTNIDASQLEGCTILAKVSAGDARYLKFVSLNDTTHKFKHCHDFDNKKDYYYFINNCLQ